MNKLPEKFAIKHNSDNILWMNYARWLGDKKGLSFNGTCTNNYYGYNNINGRLIIDKIKPEDFQELTLEQWDNIVNGFTLPEKWCVKTTPETRGIVNDFLKSKGYYGELVGDYYVHLPFLSACASAYDTIQKDYIEITFNQFTQHVLKQEDNNNMERKIIGYAAPYDLFKGRIKKGDLFTEYSADKFVMYNKDHMTSGIATEIVEQWEAVYQSQYKIGNWVKLSNNAGGWGSAGYKVDGKVLQITDIKPNSISNKYTMYLFGDEKTNESEILRLATPEEIVNATIQTVEMGCGSDKFTLMIKNKKVYHIDEDITSYVKDVVSWIESRHKGFGNNSYGLDINKLTFSRTGCRSIPTNYSEWLNVYNLIK